MAVIGEITKGIISTYVEASAIKASATATSKALPAFLVVAQSAETSEEVSAVEVQPEAEAAPKKARTKAAE